MNRFLKNLGVVFLILLIVIAVAAAILIPKWLALDKSAISYLETNIPRVVETWNSEDLTNRSAPELLSLPGIDQLPKVFLHLSSLGKLKKLETPAGEIGFGTLAGTEFNGTWAKYGANAEFEAGPAQINVVLRRYGKTWQIMGFQVNSQALLAPGANTVSNVGAAR